MHVLSHSLCLTAPFLPSLVCAAIIGPSNAYNLPRVLTMMLKTVLSCEP